MTVGESWKLRQFCGTSCSCYLLSVQPLLAERYNRIRYRMECDQWVTQHPGSFVRAEIHRILREAGDHSIHSGVIKRASVHACQVAVRIALQSRDRMVGGKHVVPQRIGDGLTDG